MVPLDAMPVPLGNVAHYAWVDAVDHAEITLVTWTERRPAKRRTSYAINQALGGYASMHALIAERAGIASASIDHADGDGLNNTRRNLRPASLSQQQWNIGKRGNNTSGYKGVCVATVRGRQLGYCAYIAYSGQKKNLGLFASAEAAARVYDAWATEAHGVFARTNFKREA